MKKKKKKQTQSKLSVELWMEPGPRGVNQSQGWEGKGVHQGQGWFSHTPKSPGRTLRGQRILNPNLASQVVVKTLLSKQEDETLF